MKKLAVLAVLAVAAMTAFPAHAASDFVATGKILVGDLFSPVGSQTQNCNPNAKTNGVDSFTVALPAGSDDADFTATATDESGLADVDVWFLDANCDYLPDTELLNNGDEAGKIPAGAAFVEMDLFIGANATVTLTVVGVLP